MNIHSTQGTEDSFILGYDAK